MTKFLKSLLFPILLLYPSGLLEGLYINYIYIIILFFYLHITKNTTNKINYLVQGFIGLFITVLLATIFSALLANIDEVQIFSILMRYLSYVFFVLILCQTTKSYEDFSFWIKSFFITFSISVIIIIFDAFRVEFVESIFKVTSFESKNTLDVFFRAYGSYLSPISAGVFLLNILVVLVYYLFINGLKEQKQYLQLIVLIALTTIAIITTGSRTSLVGLIVLLLLVTAVSEKRLRIIFFFLLFGLLVFQTGILDNYIQNITLRIERESAISRNVFEGSGRVATLVNSIRLFLDWRTFFFGVGPAEYSTGDGAFSYAHNGFVSILLAYGLVGFSIFIYFIKQLIVNSKNTKFFKVVVFYLIVNSVSFLTSDGPTTHFWILNFVFFNYYIFYGKKYSYISSYN